MVSLDFTLEANLSICLAGIALLGDGIEVRTRCAQLGVHIRDLALQQLQGLECCDQPCHTWNSPMGRPNCWRMLTYGSVTSRAACTM